jgi:hypothetical protein
MRKGLKTALVCGSIPVLALVPAASLLASLALGLLDEKR